jgi:hypothetical protein
MASRFGDVLYWFGCIAAALLIAAGLFLAVSEGKPVALAAASVTALIFWLVGWACRYVLAGR